MGLFSFLFRQKVPTACASSVFSCLHSTPYVILDTETTGLNPSSDKIIQISAIKYNSAGVPTDVYNTYLNPGCPIPARASSINGITDKMVSTAPKAQQIRDQFISFLGNDLIVGYNVKFDLKFLNNTFDEIFAGCQYVDALEIARECLSMPDYKLGTVASRVGFKPNASFHNALTDCEAVAAILHYMGEDLNHWIRIFNTLSQCAQRRSQSVYSAPSSSLNDSQFEQGYRLWSHGEAERINGNIDAAFKLYDKARDAGYIYPFVYESYAKGYRKLKDYEKEIMILDEAIQLFKGPEAEIFVARKVRAQGLMAAQKERDAAAAQKALDKAQKAELRRKKKEEEAARPKKSCKRAIIQYSDDGTIIKEFESVTSAAQEIGVSPKSIRDAATGKQKHAGGFCWRYSSPDALGNKPDFVSEPLSPNQ